MDAFFIALMLFLFILILVIGILVGLCIAILSLIRKGINAFVDFFKIF